MGKVRLYDLAKELGLSNKDLLEKLQELGYPVKSHSSSLEDYQVKEIKERLSGRRTEAVVEAGMRPTVIRRRKKVTEVQAAEEPTEIEAPGIEVPAVVIVEMEPEPIQVRAELDEVVEIAPGEFVDAISPVEPVVVMDEEGREAETFVKAPGPMEEPLIVSEEVELEEFEEVVVEEPAEAEVSLGGTIPLGPEILEQPMVMKSAEGSARAPVSVDRPVEIQTRLEPEIRSEIKVKKIEKTTVEPARIISRPVAPQVQRPRLTPVQPIRPERPKPAPTPPPAQPYPARLGSKVLPLPTEMGGGGLADTEAKRVHKKKKKVKEPTAEEEAAAKKKTLRRREVIEKSDLYDQTAWDRPGRARRGGKPVKKIKKTEITVPKAIKRRIKVMDAITVTDLARKMGIKSADIIRKLMAMGIMANVNQAIDYDTATIVAAEFDYEVERGAFDEEEALHLEVWTDSEKAHRPPVVTVMGHVDHGKTSLLDAVRKTHVTQSEAGGITQHIGAYHVKVPGGRITFLDTPGHAAFTAMRARGAKVTDIVVLVVAADDGVMQQTREAADHAQAAGVPIIVAVNKIDKPGADPEKIRREMADMGLMPEAWGGETIFADVSAKTGQGLTELMDLILLQAEMMELRSSITGRARGRIIEARLDKGRGPVATVLVQEGRIKVGDPYVCGVFYGKVRAMFDDKGQRVEEAGPSMPIEIQGISGVPLAGDEFLVLEDEKRAKQVSQHRLLKQRETELIKTSKLTLETLFDSIKEGKIKELNLVLKADVQGSLEAISESLMKLSTEEIKIHMIHSSIGAITESDIMLASASNALVVGFNVRPNAKVQDLADQEKVQIRFYDVIYRLIDEIKEAMAGLLEPIHQERILGRAEVRQTYNVSKVGTIAGSAVIDGKVVRGAKARLLRDDVVIYDGRIISLKRLKDDAKEVLSGYECGIGLENYSDIKPGDVIEAYWVEEVAAVLE